MASNNDIQRRVKEAVAHFWQTRGKQSRKQGKKAGKKDQGARAAVTGGKQLDGFVQLIKQLLCENGIAESDVYVAKNQTILPGYFRATKEWDIVAKVRDQLIATVEFKSHIGPSFSNNFNNRMEEAVGSATDLHLAYREGALAGSPQPWLGYLILVKKCDRSLRPVKVQQPHYPVFQDFVDASYVRRYELLCQRLVRERLYHAACLILSEQETGPQGEYEEPENEIGIDRFMTSLTAHAIASSKYL